MPDVRHIQLGSELAHDSDFTGTDQLLLTVSAQGEKAPSLLNPNEGPSIP
jgi:hypothetical protein